MVQSHLWRWQAQLDQQTDDILATGEQEEHGSFYDLLDLWRDLRSVAEELARITNAGAPDTGGT